METIQKQFVTYEIAFAMKELGFNEHCFAMYCNHGKPQSIGLFTGNDPNRISKMPSFKLVCNAPLWQQCTDWFREKYNYDIQIKYPHTETNKIEGINSVFYDIEIYKLRGGDAYKVYKFCQISDNYKRAYEQAILKAIELCKKQKEI